MGLGPHSGGFALAGYPGGSLAIGMVLHPRRPLKVEAAIAAEQPPEKLRSGRPRLIGNSTSIEILPPRPPNKREHVSLFLREVLKPDPSAQASLRSLHARYNEWLRLKPNPVFDVAPGQQRPIGAASSAEGISRCCCFPARQSSMNCGTATYTAVRCRVI